MSRLRMEADVVGDRETRRENAVIYIFIALMVIMIALAMIGYFSGRWDIK